MRIAGIIPARFASTRFPGKPLAMVAGKPMIQRVYEQSVKAVSLNDVFVATDDSRIEKAVSGFGGSVIMTSEKHKSGTDRCMEAVEKLELAGKIFDAVINIQGDEPFIEPESIETVAGLFSDPDVQIATLAKEIARIEDLFNPNVNKVIIDKQGNAIYFSRHPIPFMKDRDQSAWIENHTYLKHLGIYGYRTSVLRQITRLGISGLEKAESLEQLRWIENGYRIRVGISRFDSIAVDTPEDLLKLLNIH
jgi:3-deoxy-manno-octulosonate cytidylyltransferase (CMP-KDO synthetase)